MASPLTRRGWNAGRKQKATLIDLIGALDQVALMVVKTIASSTAVLCRDIGMWRDAPLAPCLPVDHAKGISARANLRNDDATICFCFHRQQGVKGTGHTSDRLVGVCTVVQYLASAVKRRFARPARWHDGMGCPCRSGGRSKQDVGRWMTSQKIFLRLDHLANTA